MVWERPHVRGTATSKVPGLCGAGLAVKCDVEGEGCVKDEDAGVGVIGPGHEEICAREYRKIRTEDPEAELFRGKTTINP